MTEVQSLLVTGKVKVMNQATKRRTIIGIIVLVFANTAAGGAEWCSSALADIASVFPDVPYSIITLVNNIPNLCAVVFTVVAGILVNRKITLRNMLLIGIGCHCIGGILPALFGDTSMAMMFLGRFAFGIGYGLMQGIGISMSLKLIEDTRFRSHAMGWAVAAQYAMNMVAQVVVGHLCAIKWNYSFFVYLWSAIPFLVVLFLCPKFELDQDDKSTAGSKLEAMAKSGSLGAAVRNLPPIVWVFSVIAIAYMICYYPMFLVIANIIVGRGIGNSVTVGNAMVFYSVATILGGIVFGFAQKLLKNKTMCIMLAITGLSMFGLYKSYSFASVAAWLVVSGIASTGIIPACINAFSDSVQEDSKFLATSIAESGINIGAFLGTPYIALIELFGGKADTAMFISPIIMLALGLITLKFYRPKS
jgi:MFS family permease